MSKIKLEIVKTVVLHDVSINVRLASYKYVRAVSQAQDDESRIDKMAELIANCCEYEDGSPVDVDELSMNDIPLLTNIALGGNVDFQTPPGESPSAGAE